LGESPLYPIGEYIIESLDENGYMTMSEEMIAGELGASIDDVEEVLRVTHTFDPMGVGASSLSECLTIQLEQMGQLTDVFRLIIDEHLEDLASNKISYLAKKTGASPAQIQEMGDMIRMLEPKPGRQFASQSETKYIIPDVIVERIDGEYVITMNNGNVPHLMVSSYYQKLLKESERDEELSKYLSDRVNSAVWLIKSIEQRKQTIYNVVDAIVEYQRDYFDKGSKHLKPLTLRDIAERVGVHESTVSRTVNGKYMQSPHGVNELKYFFTAGVSSASGDGISRSSIKEFIKEIIDKEDPRNPISDQHIAEMLGRQQINISRRTVAKYRDEMNISPSSKRRRY
jgi:RNA polymerase sigma-54 factor